MLIALCGFITEIFVSKQTEPIMCDANNEHNALNPFNY